MPLERPDLQSMLARVRVGDEDAAQELLRHFEPHVRRVVRRRLPTMLRSKFDSMDFVQSVWGEFFARLGRGEIAFDNAGQLAKFLALVAQSKVANETKRRTALKCDVKREVDLSDNLFHVPGRSRDPTPSQRVAANDELETVLSRHPKLHRNVVELRRQGFTFTEIGEQLNIDERSARRILHDLEEELGGKNAGQ